MFEYFEKGDDVKRFIRIGRMKFFRTQSNYLAKTVRFACKTDRTLIHFNARNFEPRITRQRKKISHAATEIEQSSQSLPSIPPWAKGLDMDGIVQLDALIDENGNVAEAKPMSGPRLLQRAAERAVALWIFQPALSDGKPTATHIVLTVQFQR